MVVFMIVGKSEPLFEMEVSKSSAESTEELQYLHQFILFSSLDNILSNMWSNSSTFLRVVDKFNYTSVSAYATQGGKVFLLLHSGKSEDAVRAFFLEAHELYVKHLLNPFAEPEGQITSPHFAAQVRTIAKRIL